MVDIYFNSIVYQIDRMNYFWYTFLYYIHRRVYKVGENIVINSYLINSFIESTKYRIRKYMNHLG